MNLENNLDHTHLMSVGDGTTLDVIKETNKDASLNQDLETVMNNAHFTGEALLVTLQPAVPIQQRRRK